MQEGSLPSLGPLPNPQATSLGKLERKTSKVHSVCFAAARDRWVPHPSSWKCSAGQSPSFPSSQESQANLAIVSRTQLSH